MKKITILALSAFLFTVSCKESKTDDATTTTEQSVAESKGEMYTINTDSSSVNWKAYHKGGLNPRFGITKTTGTLSVENGNLTSGSLISDINSLTTDPKSVDPKASEGKTSADLDGHLKNADFFDVAKYPTVKFEITKVEDLAAGTSSKTEGANKTVSGNLTIKDKTVNVTFPAKVEITGNEVKMWSKFTINRQDWGLAYGAEGDVKDWAISQEVDLDMNIVATK
ncbi:YceI family protein [Frigoriflavimonas asaccharolytica]|uniref:Polyisoprenoid-binding protein YceI n=1 Tax=Frigoriflavimonas asaccharolytica TaxID=2735899 RepID=A0A8J8GBH3_9FLAO|nr:YceI family protein [Frigoriflavimonas asaccharolytica]NRS92905.1 polyisoprenoid-binding protein YceI [Frigoriflavimonas asaccharolytica]